MITSVFLSNSEIRVAVGKNSGQRVELKKVYTLTTPEGTMINGIITNEAEFIDAINEFWTANNIPRKDVHLVINSSEFVKKPLNMPVLSKRKMLEYIQREYADIDRAHNPIYSYYGMAEDKKTRMTEILAIMAEKSFVESHIKVFEEANIRVKRVESALCGGIRAIGRFCKNKKDSMIYIYQDGENLISILWGDGKYMYSTASRLFSENATYEFATEVLRQVTSIIQFADSQKIKNAVNRLYISGMSHENYAMCKNLISQANNRLTVDRFPLENIVSFAGGYNETKQSASNYLFNVGSIMEIGNGEDFYLQLNKNQQMRDKIRVSLLYLLPIVCTAVISLAVVTALYFVTQNKQDEFTQISNFLNSKETVQRQNEYDDAEAEYIKLDQKYQSLKESKDDIATYPTINTGIIKIVDECSSGTNGIMIQSFDANTGLLKFAASANKVQQINEFISRLKKQSIFKKIDYSGYSFNETDNNYNIDLTCYLSEGAGRK